MMELVDMADVGRLLTPRLACGFLDGFGIDFEFDLLAHGQDARFERLVVFDPIVHAIQLRFGSQSNAKVSLRVFGWSSQVGG